MIALLVLVLGCALTVAWAPMALLVQAWTWLRELPARLRALLG